MMENFYYEKIGGMEERGYGEMINFHGNLLEGDWSVKPDERRGGGRGGGERMAKAMFIITSNLEVHTRLVNSFLFLPPIQEPYSPPTCRPPKVSHMSGPANFVGNNRMPAVYHWDPPRGRCTEEEEEEEEGEGGGHEFLMARDLGRPGAV